MNREIERKMFYGARPHIFEKAKELRNNMTAAELRLWEILKKNQILELRFRAQHPIDMFIVDFYCHPLKIVIEVDGGIHLSEEQKKYDIGRTEELKKHGIKVIRFTNEKVLYHIDDVIKAIIKEVDIRKKDIKSLLKGI